MTFEYTHHTPVKSSALTDVWYNEGTEEMVVAIKREQYSFWSQPQSPVDGPLAGYEDVPLDVYKAFVMDKSVGQYWNLWIKPNFKGFNTSYITEFVDVVTETDPVEPAPVVDTPVNDEVDVTRYDVGYFTEEFSDDLLDHDPSMLEVWAESEDDAVARFEKVAEAVGWDEYSIVFVVHYYV